MKITLMSIAPLLALAFTSVSQAQTPSTSTASLAECKTDLAAAMNRADAKKFQVVQTEAAKATELVQRLRDSFTDKDRKDIADWITYLEKRKFKSRTLVVDAYGVNYHHEPIPQKDKYSSKWEDTFAPLFSRMGQIASSYNDLKCENYRAHTEYALNGFSCIGYGGPSRNALFSVEMDPFFTSHSDHLPFDEVHLEACLSEEDSGFQTCPSIKLGKTAASDSPVPNASAIAASHWIKNHDQKTWDICAKAVPSSFPESLIGSLFVEMSASGAIKVGSSSSAGTGN